MSASGTGVTRRAGRARQLLALKQARARIELTAASDPQRTLGRQTPSGHPLKLKSRPRQCQRDGARTGTGGRVQAAIVGSVKLIVVKRG